MLSAAHNAPTQAAANIPKQGFDMCMCAEEEVFTQMIGYRLLQWTPLTEDSTCGLYSTDIVRSRFTPTVRNDTEVHMTQLRKELRWRL